MFVLEIIAGAFKGQAQPLAHGQTLSVGRSPDNELMLPDVRISAKHAEVTWSDDGFNVFDLGSANGTFVNGQRIQGRVGIRVGDHLQFGDVVVALKSVDIEDSNLSLLSQTQEGIMAFRSGSTQMMRRTIPSAKSASLPASMPSQERTVQPSEGMLALGNQRTQVGSKPDARLDDQTVTEAASLKQKLEVAPSGAKLLVHREQRFDPFWATPVTIGREHGSGIVLDDNLVSLRHAVIDHRGDHYLVRDVGSSNGVFVNQKRIVEQKLQDGDVISVGTHTILVVQGAHCLGLQVQPPSLITSPREASSTHIGVLDQPLGLGAAKKKKKKASELVWYGTSDLDRGVFRARSALIALILGVGLTFWMLFQGDSEVLAGAHLSAAHEDAEFLGRIAELGQDRCTACHVGAGKVSTLKCLDCHPDNRPLEGHAEADVACARCHMEHRGQGYKLGVAGLLTCIECHLEPHEKLKRTKPKLVAAFALDAPADVAFHVQHESKGVHCLSCHATSEHSKRRGIRGACSQCHAPEHPEADACQQCHMAHPDRKSEPLSIKDAVAPEAPPRFALTGLLYTLGLLVVSFGAAALVPKKKKEVATPEAAP